MREAGRRLVGERDYRNFCKMDVGNGVVTFFRRIDDINFNILDKEPNVYVIASCYYLIFFQSCPGKLVRTRD